MSGAEDPAAAAAAEIVRLHEVIEGWLRGTLPRERFEADLAEAVHPAFEWVGPSGNVVTGAAFLREMGGAHGANPDFRITIEEPRLLGQWPGLILAGYVEHQTGARLSAAENRRRSTVLFETGPRLLWRHLHETALAGG